MSAHTPRPDDHGAFDELAVGWALHALEPEDEAVFARHLPGCSRCARTVDETAAVMATMAADLPSAEPSPRLRQRLREAVERTEQVDRPPAPPDPVREPAGRRPAGHPQPVAPPARAWSARRPDLRRATPVALAAAAVAAVLGLGVWNVVLADARDEAMAMAEERGAVVERVLLPGSTVTARLTDEEGAARATVVMRNGEMTVVTQDFEANDEAREIYVLWGIDEGDPVPLGTFDVERSGWDVETVGSGPTGEDGGDGFAQYAVSREQGREAPREPTQIVASGEVAG